MGEVTEERSASVRESKRVAPEEPLERRDAAGEKREEQERERVLAAHKSNQPRRVSFSCTVFGLKKMKLS